MQVRKLTLIGLFIAISLVLHIIEASIPLPFVAPGAKLGLANITTVISLYMFGKKDTLFIMVTRVILGSIYGGGFSGFVYSFTGAMFSYVAMIFIMHIAKDSVSAIGVSATGAFFHSFGQIVVSMFFMGTFRMITYLPALSIASVLSGAFIGLVAIHVTDRLYKVQSGF